MSRDDAYLSAMLQHLGASYYKTLNGGGAATEVARAVDAVADAEDGRELTHQAGRSGANGDAGSRPGGWRHRNWRISDVMTVDVATADPDMTCKRLVKLMTDRQVNAVPVVDSGRKVRGMVSEADVLRKQEGHRARSVAIPLPHHRTERSWEAQTVEKLMTSPAITVHPDAALGAAARLMNAHHIRRLPVVDGSGALVGVVSRRDLMKVFLRPDSEIEDEIRDVLAGILLGKADGINISVSEGVVTLTGTLAHKDALPVVTRLASDVPGVVAVTSHLADQDQDAAGS